MKLIIEDDEGRKTVVPIVREDVEITIGRQEGNTIRLTERNVSRKHARLARKNGSVVIHDLSSYNGIKVNGDRIQGSLQLKEGDLVQIGDYDLAIQSDEQKAAAASPSAPTQQELGAVDGEATLQTELPDGEEATNPSSAPSPAPAAPAAAKRHDSTSIVSSNQLKATKTRKVVDIPPEEAPRLLIVTTDLTGREFACIRSELKIGRTDDNDIAIDHRSLSRNHCKVIREDNGEWKVIDLQSANGVKVNGEQYAESVLKSGDVLELGHLHFKFLGPGEDATAVPSPRPAAEADASGDEAPRKSGKSLPLILGAAVMVVGGVGGAGWYFLVHKKPTPIVHADPDKPAVKDPEPVKPPEPPPSDPVVAQPNPPDVKPEDPKPPTPTPPVDVKPPEPKAPDLPPVHPKVAKAFEEGKDLLSKNQFAKAEKKLALAKDYGVEEAAPLLEKARAEMEAERLLADAEKLFKGGDLAGARKALDSIAADSFAAGKSKPFAAQLKTAEEKKAKAEEAAKAKAGNEKAAVAEEAYNQGQTLFADRKYKEAAEFFEKAIAADPSHAKAHMYLGTCFAKTNRFDEGAVQYEEFVHLAPNDEMAPRVVELLKQYFAKPGQKAKPRYPLK